MSRAYKLENASATIEAIKSAQEGLADLQDRAHKVAAGIGPDVTVRFRRRNLTNDTSGVSFGVRKDDAALAEGWRYVKTRDAVEPVRGAKGDAGREALESLEVPMVQPNSIVGSTGMPMLFMRPGRVYTTQWMHHEGSLYALLPDEDDTFRDDPITGDWKEIRLSELHTADEARLDAAKVATAGQS
jgi:hypothetical protein